MWSLRFVVFLSMVCGSALACASTANSTLQTSHNRISADEIAAMQGQVGNLYDLVDRLRPRWLVARASGDLGGGSGPGVVVYKDQQYLGAPSELRNFGLDYAVSLRYLDAAEAVAQLPGLGSRQVGGAIVVNTR